MINWENAGLAAVMSVFTGVISFSGALYIARQRSATGGHVRDEGRMRAVEDKVALIEDKVTPISAVFQAMLINKLTHFHTPELDALMKKIGPPMMLTEKERVRLAVLLEERTRDMGSEIDDSERDAAVMLPMVMSRVAAEASLPAEHTDTILVSVPKQIGK